MRLHKTLTDFIRVVTDEAEHNPEFGHRLMAALKIAVQTDDAQRNADRHKPGDPWPKNRRAPAALDPIETARDGESALRARLEALSIEQLKDIVAQFSMDSGKLVAKWKNADKIIERIVYTSMARVQKGDAFRKDRKEPTKGD